MLQHYFINLWELEFQMNSEFQEMSTFIMCITMRVLQSLCFNVKSNYCTIIEKRSNIQFQTTFTWVFWVFHILRKHLEGEGGQKFPKICLFIVLKLLMRGGGGSKISKNMLT